MGPKPRGTGAYTKHLTPVHGWTASTALVTRRDELSARGSRGCASGGRAAGPEIQTQVGPLPPTASGMSSSPHLAGPSPPAQPRRHGHRPRGLPPGPPREGRPFQGWAWVCLPELAPPEPTGRHQFGLLTQCRRALLLRINVLNIYLDNFCVKKGSMQAISYCISRLPGDWGQPCMASMRGGVGTKGP